MIKYPRLVTHLVVSIPTTPWGAEQVIKWHQKGRTFVAPIQNTLCPGELINQAIQQRHNHKGTEELRFARILVTLKLWDNRIKEAK